MQPVRRNIILVAFVLGLLIPVVVIFVRENMNTTVRGRNDLKNITVPFLGEIPFSISRKNRPTLMQRIQRRKKPQETRQIVVKAGKRDFVNEAFQAAHQPGVYDRHLHPEQNVIILRRSTQARARVTWQATSPCRSPSRRRRCSSSMVTSAMVPHPTLVGSPGEGLSDYLNGRTDDLKGIICHGEDHGSRASTCCLSVPMPLNPYRALFTDRLGEMIKQVRAEIRRRAHRLSTGRNRG